MPEAETKPHAYGVETLWNPGTRSERWGLALEMRDVYCPLDREGAEQLLEDMIEDGHGLDDVRLIGFVVIEGQS